MFNYFKNAAIKIGNGLLYGIGIGITAGLIMYFISEQMTASVWNDAALAKVVITKHEEVKRDQTAIFLGTIENSGTETVRMPSIQVDLFDEKGKFVEQCSEYIKGALKPKDSRNFKVTCSGCKDHPTIEHASYKVRVIGL